MKIIKLLFIYMLLALFICINPSICKSDINIELENIAKNALLEKYSEYKNKELRLIEKKTFNLNNEVTIFRIVAFENADNFSIFFVAIDNNRCTYLFPGNIERNVGEFNKLVVNNKIHINDKNLPKFIDDFLYLVDYNANIISRYDDFKYLRDDIPKFYNTDIDPIKPLKFEIRNNEISAEFFSWNDYIFSKWKIIFSNEGKILSYKHKELFRLF